MPSSSSARRRSDSVRGLMPASDRSSSQKRERPSARSRITSSVHLPQTTSAVRQTGQVSSGVAMRLPRWYREASGNEVNQLPITLPSSPPAPPLPPLPDDTALMAPSDGCTRTQPWPPKAIWNCSPEPLPIRSFILTLALTDVVTPDDHVIAACGSAKVGAWATLSSTGGPSERIATQPVPCRAVLYRPPPLIPLTPWTRSMSQSMPASNASTFGPLTVTLSFSR